MLHKQSSEQRVQTSVLAELLVSLLKIAVVLIITLSFIFYLVTPPSSGAFFTSNTQSNTIVREVRPD